MDGTDVRELPARIETLLDQVAARGDSAITELAEELVAAVLSLYGEGLTRVVGALGEGEVRELADDELIAGLLLLHGLHPDDVGTRIQRALDKVRPYLGSHAGGIDYVGVDEHGVAHLSLQGSCDGCAGSIVTVQSAIERAVLEAAPEVASIDVAGMVAEPHTQPQPQLLQIGIRCPDGLVEAAGR